MATFNYTNNHPEENTLGAIQKLKIYEYSGVDDSIYLDIVKYKNKAFANFFLSKNEYVIDFVTDQWPLLKSRHRIRNGLHTHEASLDFKMPRNELGARDLFLQLQGAWLVCVCYDLNGKAWLVGDSCASAILTMNTDLGKTPKGENTQLFNLSCTSHEPPSLLRL